MKKNSLCVCVCPFASGSKKHFFRKTDFPSPDAKKSVFRVNKRFSIKFDQRESCTKNLNLLQIGR